MEQERGITEMMKITKKAFFKILISTAAMIAFALGMGARAFYRWQGIKLIENLWYSLWIVAGILFTALLVEFFLSNYIWKGFRYTWNHWRIKNRLIHQMLDAGFGIERSYWYDLPKIKLSFAPDFASGTLRIRNNLKHNKKLDDMVLSAALGKFIVEEHYQTDDGNYYVYKLVDGSVSFKIQFRSFQEFLDYNAKIPTYSLFLDARSQVKFQHMLIAGQTGSGKTYFLYNLILQMQNKAISPMMYFADPKGSSLAVIGNAIAKERTAVEFEDIIQLLERFVEAMHTRKAEIAVLLESKIDADYSDFGKAAHIFLFDEFASFVAVLASQEKKVRDRVKALLYECVLQGRQLGFFLILAMQKADATLIDTAIRENMPFKVVLGNSEPQTYVTAFGTGVDIPERDYQIGEGVFMEPVLAPRPKLVQAPKLDFDILDACKGARVV